MKNDGSLRDLCDNIKQNNICITGVSGGEKREEGAKTIFEEIIDGKFPDLGKETDIHVHIHYIMRVPNKMNPKKSTPKHIIIKMAKIKDKERLLKAAREKLLIRYKRTPIRQKLTLQQKFAGQRK